MYKNFSIIVLLILSASASAQCAMCKAVVEGGSEDIAEGVNNGITYLMVFPYILVGTLAYFIYRYNKKAKNKTLN